MRTKSLFILAMLFGATLRIFAQGQGWSVKLTLPKNEYLPGEPIRMSITIENTGPAPLHFYGFRGAYYLDGSQAPCESGLKVSADFPPRNETAGRPPALQPVGTLHEGTEDLAWLCQLREKGLGAIGSHTVCYRAPVFLDLPAMEGCVTFTILRPLGEDVKAYEHFKGEPLKGSDVIGRYPTSNYAALVLWQEGLRWYEGGTMPESGAEKDFAYLEAEKKALEGDTVSISQRSRELEKISDPWERLYSEFPKFGYRARLLYGLTRCYFRLGEYQKAAPLLRELLTKFPDTEWAKKGATYRDVLKAHGKWPE